VLIGKWRTRTAAVVTSDSYEVFVEGLGPFAGLATGGFKVSALTVALRGVAELLRAHDARRAA
jgi:hypothetical protein